jgi:membrane-associated phospholipid phosphatase
MRRRTIGALSPRRVAAAALAATMGIGASARADDFPSPVEAFGDDTVRAFTGTSLFYFAGAAGATLALSPTGGDHAVRVALVEHIDAPLYGDAAFYGGYVLPVLVAPGLYLGGLVARDRGLAGAGSAAVEALALTFVTTVVLKIATGRPFPLHGGDPRAPDRLDHPEYAKEFSPFGFAGRYAWPSGHTSGTISVAAALTAYSHDVVVGITSYTVSLGIGFGMMVGDHHWTSDVVAGALIGQAIGWSVGSSFRERRTSTSQAGLHWELVPWLGPARGAALVGVF